jgi:hypothetical protein
MGFGKPEDEEIESHTGTSADDSRHAIESTQKLDRHHIHEEALDNRADEHVKQLKTNDEKGYQADDKGRGRHILQKADILPQKSGEFSVPTDQNQTQTEKGQCEYDKRPTAPPTAPEAIALEAHERANRHVEESRQRCHHH